MLTMSTEPAEAVTVDVEALWVLQAMLDIPTLPPELRSLPYGAAQTKDWLTADPRVETFSTTGWWEPTGKWWRRYPRLRAWRYRTWKS